MRSIRIVYILLAVLILVPTSFVYAEDLDLEIATETGKPKNVVGLGIGYAPDYEGSEDYQAVPLLRFKYNWDNGMNVSFFGNTLKANLLNNDTWNAGPLLRYRAERDDVDNNQVDAMDKVDAAVELGAFVSLKVDKWIFILDGAQDISDSHDGYVIDFKGGYTHFFNQQTGMIAFAETSYASDDYMETYFGVDSGNRGSSTLDNFKIDGGMKDVGVGVAVMHNLSETWELLFLGKYTAILEDAKDSPIVDDEGDANQFLGGVMVSYRF